MNGLTVLRNTLLKLKKKEINSLVTFLKCYRKDAADQSLKSIQLVKVLLKNKKQTSDQIQLTLYGKNNYHAFNKLVNRLKEKIYEVIMLDSNLIKSDHYGKRNKTVFEIRKKLLQTEIMFARGMNEDIESIQSKIIQKAKEYEIYDSLLTALYAKQRHLGFRFGTIAYQKLKNEIELYKQLHDKIIRARKLFNNITSRINFTTSPKEYQFESNNILKILQNDFEKTKSATIAYYYLFLKVEKCYNMNNLLAAQEALMQLRELLENNPSVYTDNRMGSTLMNMALNKIFMFDFENSLENIKKAIHFFPEINLNIQLVQELEFHILFYSDKIEKAEKLIEELYHTSRTSEVPFLYSKRAYLLACVKTLKGNLALSNELLKEVNEIKKDKEGWNIGVRLLSIMNFIGLENFEKADREIEKMRRNISKTMAIKNIRKRYLIIQEIFLELMHQGYNFQKAYKNKKHHFELLESNDLKYRWQIKSPEMIIFQEWFMSKMEGRHYNQIKAIQKEKEKNVQTES